MRKKMTLAELSIYGFTVFFPSHIVALLIGNVGLNLQSNCTLQVIPYLKLYYLSKDATQ